MDGRARRVLGLALVAAAAVAARIVLAPRPVDPQTVAPAILDLRTRIAAAGVVMGAGLGLAAVGSQAQARDPSVDASIAGPAWGALPALLVPAPLWIQALLALVGAWLVARLTRGSRGGLETVLARGGAVAGFVVSLAALGLFLGPGLTPTTATAFLHAALGGALPQATWPRILLGAGLLLVGSILALTRWRQLVLTRTGLGRDEPSVRAVTALGAAGSVLVAGVVAGLGLLATRSIRGLVGEDPRALVPGAIAAAIALGVALDGLAQALAWPGELPVGVLTTVAASILLAWRVVPLDRV